MKVLINRLPVEGPWGGGNNFVKALVANSSRLGFSLTSDLREKVDLIFVLDPRYDHLGISAKEVFEYKQRHPSVKVVYRINECDARKGKVDDIDPLINFLGSFADAGIFVSNWIFKHHVERVSWKCSNNYVVVNGVDKSIFKPHVRSNSPEYPIKIVTHHWSDNDMKGFDIYRKIDEWVESHPDFVFTYIGRSSCTLPNTRIVSPIFGKTLGDELAQHDVYVSASKFDPGPNHITESIACGLPTFAHVDGGGASEFVGASHLFSDFDQLETVLLRKQYHQNDMTLSTWDECVETYANIMKSL